MRFVLVISIFALSFCSSKHTSDRGFYYWKTDVLFSKQDISDLHKNSISKIYIHLFDIDWDKDKNLVLPIAKAKIDTLQNFDFEIIPTIYITNNSLQKTDFSHIDSLANNIYSLCSLMCRSHKITFNEIQIDCDWTETTRIKYFALLQNIKTKLNLQNKKLSATIRLHQIKYYKKTGIPPIDRGMLMFYNMGQINCSNQQNSIFNMHDAELYVSYIKNYTIPLDFALPLFSWAIHCRHDKVENLINSVSVKTFEKDTRFKKINKNQFIANQSFLYHGMYILQNDIITVETITPELCEQAATMLDNNIYTSSKNTITLFDYSSYKHLEYDNNTLEKIFNKFR